MITLVDTITIKNKIEKRKRFKDIEKDYSSIDEENSDTILENFDDKIEDTRILKETKSKEIIRIRKHCSGRRTAN